MINRFYSRISFTVISQENHDKKKDIFHSHISRKSR